MNRRSLLALLGGAVAAPSVGVKSAAAALGVDAALTASDVMGSTNEPAGLVAGPATGGWWGSPAQIAFDARDRTRYEMQQGAAFPHMKSWGHGFRTMQADRDNVILQLYRQKMQDDEDFRARVVSALMGAK